MYWCPDQVEQLLGNREEGGSDAWFFGGRMCTLSEEIALENEKKGKAEGKAEGKGYRHNHRLVRPMFFTILYSLPYINLQGARHHICKHLEKRSEIPRSKLLGIVALMHSKLRGIVA